MSEALEQLAAEFRVLAANTAIIQTQEGRHLANGLIRLAEAMSCGKPVTPPISTHNA